MTKEDLAKALELHLKWLRCEAGGARANLSGANSVWLVGIEPADIADVVVPFRTDGKFRAARVRLIRQLTDAERRQS